MYIGIDIGGTKCAFIKADDNGNKTEKVKFDTLGRDETINRIIKETEKMCECGEELRGIGISCGGPLDEKNGIIQSPPNLPGWDDVHITDILEEHFGVKSRLCNDANACAVAEWRFGAGKGSQNMIFLTFGTGFGAGIILDGRLYSGTNGNAGEIGHVRCSDHGPVGYGKLGSFEGFCSGSGIKQLGQSLALEKLQRGEAVGYCKNTDALENVTAKSVSEAAFAGDETAIEVYRLSARKLGMCLSLLIDLLNPEVIVIGSVFARSESLFREEMEKVINREALAASASVCRVVPAMLGDEIGDFAAIAVAMMS